MATILCVADSNRRLTYLGATAKKLGYRVATAVAPDHAVALCVSRPEDIVAIVMDEDLIIDGWSVADSLKMVAPKIPILLVCDKGAGSSPPPKGVDLVTKEGSRHAIMEGLKALLQRSASASA